MFIASAQINSVKGAIHNNLENHIEYIKVAVQRGVELILFPELSLTDYIREGASELSLTIYDASISLLRDYAMSYNICIVIGAPVHQKSGLHIGSLILTPEGGIDLYTKQYLHNGEEKFYESSFEYNPILYLGDYKSQFAICADIENSDHPKAAAVNKVKLYLASIFYTAQGIDNLHLKMASYAKEYKMNILISNFCGESYQLPAGGGSAFWNEEGKLIAELDRHSSGLLLINLDEENSSGEALYL